MVFLTINISLNHPNRANDGRRVKRWRPLSSIGLKPIIFEEYPGLEKLPWMELGDFPTPVEHLKCFGEAVGLENLYIKRDDRSSRLYGGNKVRKLEFILADAKERGRRTLITAGAVGSNQVLATGIYGRQLGFRVIGIVMD
ncbi:pyridoxal-phosphate dependent enzyme, partial [Candidatus Bathyarchaeota archaeon]|nr:pyridoxal-phosphate dependent enzyme [Candidatus Bathyarchaeota archaeon]